MPRSVAEERARIDDPDILAAIKAAIRQCKYGVAIRTPGYDTEHSPWTQTEYHILNQFQNKGRMRLFEIDTHKGVARQIGNLRSEIHAS